MNEAFIAGFVDELDKHAGGKWIQKAIKHKGALHQQLGVPEDKKIPAKTLKRAAGAPGKLGRRARLAETLRRMKD